MSAGRSTSLVAVALLSLGMGACSRQGAAADEPAPRPVPPPSASAGLEELRVHVTDSVCLLRSAPGEPGHRECAIRCIHAGADVALVERETNQVRIAVPSGEEATHKLLLPHVGSEVLARGRTKVSDAGVALFEVHEVVPAHVHTPVFGGAVGMAGELHVEVLAVPGQVKVYLSDVFRRALPADGQRGVVQARIGGATRSAELRPDGDGRALIANVAGLADEPVELTVELSLTGAAAEHAEAAAGKAVAMTFLVDPQGTAAPPPTRRP